jgi:hypothetical protein
MGDAAAVAEATTEEWTLWDGLQTLPKPSPPSLTRDGASNGALGDRARQHSQTEIEELVSQYRHGFSIDTLFRRYNVHRATVMHHLDRSNVARRLTSTEPARVTSHMSATGRVTQARR